jgi:beta-glucosidase
MFNEFGAECRYWITINEPLVYVYNSYIRGIWPPGVKSLSRAKNVISNLINAHKQAYWIIHRIAQERCYYFPLVSIAKNMRVFLPCRVASPLDRLTTYLRTRAFNFYFLDKIKNHLDFIGVNYYTREFVRFTRFRDRAQAPSSSDLFGQTCESSHHARRKKNYLGWESYPEGIFSILMSLKKYGLPILITENGTCDDDESRFQFILEHLKQLNRAIKGGVNVFGYLYWSLIDNFEWEHGFSPRFGLIEVDYSNYQRKIRTSGLKYAKICQANCIENIE